MDFTHKSSIIRQGINRLIFKLVALFLFSILFIGCNRENLESNILTFDVDIEGKKIVYSYLDKTTKKAGLYLSDINGENVTHLLQEDYLSFINPRFSGDGKQIICIGVDDLTYDYSIWLIDVKNNTAKKIENIIENGFITSAIMSSDNTTLYYTLALSFGNHSPLAKKQFHNFDIYKYDLENSTNEKISDVDLYGIYHLAEYDKDKLVMTVYNMNKGLYLYNLKANELSKIETINDTLRLSKGYAKPNVTIDGDIICTSFYSLVKIDMKTKMEKSIIHTTGVNFNTVKFNEKLNSIFYNRYDGTNEIYEIDQNANLKRKFVLKAL